MRPARSRALVKQSSRELPGMGGVVSDFTDSTDFMSSLTLLTLPPRGRRDAETQRNLLIRRDSTTFDWSACRSGRRRAPVERYPSASLRLCVPGQLSHKSLDTRSLADRPGIAECCELGFRVPGTAQHLVRVRAEQRRR